MAERATCANCAYRIEEGDRIWCGRYPPAVVANTYSRSVDYSTPATQEISTEIECAWPDMAPDELCGEHKAGIGIKSKEAAS